MMKNIIYILGILFISSNSSSKNYVSDTDSKDNNGTYSVNIPQDEPDLNGTWGLTNYFDTIITNKELAKYRLQTPTWFAILLEIDNDSLKSFGSIDKAQYLIKRTGDTITTLTSNISGDKWFLILKEPELKLIQYSNSKRVDSTIYTFRKRDDLNYFSKDSKDFFVIGNNVTDYFNKQLFEGKYINTKSNSEVIFGENGQLIGVEGFDSYEVRNYFGTLHMHKNLDVITFKNKHNNVYKQYNWVFSDDELLLTEFVHEKVTYKGKTHDGEYLVLGKEKIKLKKH
tara:strand:- start:415 stop:1266 length:852 start_codon:yes stop_codon:yes gene_type:complete